MIKEREREKEREEGVRKLSLNRVDRMPLTV